MARIYSGFNGLGLGQAINSLYNAQAEQRRQNIDQLATGLSSIMQGQIEASREAERKKSAIDFLIGNGYDQQKAEQFVNTVDPSEAVKYLQGRLDKKADTEDDRAYEEKIHGRDRGEAISDRDNQRAYDESQREKIWAHEWDDWMKKNGISYEQGVKQMQFSQLMQQLGLITSKDWGNSRKGVDQYNDTIKTLQDFAEKNPEFTAILGAIKPSFDNGGNEGYYDEDLQSGFRKYGSKDYTDDDREAFLKRLIDNNKFSYVMDNPMFKDAILTFGANVDKNNLMKQVNLQRLLGNTVTETQRGKQRQNADWANRKKNLANMISEAYNDRAHSKAFPDLNENELAAMKEIFKKNPWVLNHYLKK